MIKVFRHHVPASFFSLFGVEFIVLFFTSYLTELVLVTTEWGFSAGDQQRVILNAIVFAVVLTLMSMLTGSYNRDVEGGKIGRLTRLIVAFVFGYIVLAIVSYSFPELNQGRRLLAFSLPFGFSMLVVTRLVFFRMVKSDRFNRRVLVVGAGENAQTILMASRAPNSGFVVVGCLSVSGELPVVNDATVVSASGGLNQYVDEYDIDEIVVAISDRGTSVPMDELLACKFNGSVITDFHQFLEKQTGKLRLDIRPSALVYSDGFSMGALSLYIKRGLDVVASLLLLLITWPVMFLAAVAIWLEDKGPIFYTQTRTGQDMKPFQVIKFRSMRTDAEKAGAQWAAKHDSRITRVGQFIRKVRIDELPQLFNVFNGDMSFVGPRPERPEFVNQFCETIPYYGFRHAVKPGITGWAQIRYPYGDCEEDAEEKLKYDLYYIKNYSLFLDLSIITQTVEVILWGKGAQ